MEIEAHMAVVERPGGKPYRAKLPPEALYWDDEGSYSGFHGVVVRRTHDVALATELARVEYRREVGEDPVMPTGRQSWMRLVPWGGDGGSWEAVDPGDRGATPCVTFLWRDYEPA